MCQLVPVQFGDLGQIVDVPQQVVHAAKEPEKLRLALALGDSDERTCGPST